MEKFNVDAYKIIEQKEMKDLNSEGMLLYHQKSGAKIVTIKNEDPNKVFYIGFRTTPDDSTGVAHILEHSVLCGSRKFPVKDPFIELAKGSLNTFLNAMTYPDKTVYPVASCNLVDFKNLMDVYMDAVFYPNIDKERKIFMQEGWHYELEDKNAPLKINGVVYNEMKGAFSSPDDVLDRAIINTLYPENTYANESGGDPDVIPDLSYEEFLNFHKKYYHPSNSYIYLYGDLDMEERLQWLDENYLSAFDFKDMNTEIKKQLPFSKPVDKQLEYSITSDEKVEDNTYLSYNAVVGDSLDAMEYIAFQILDFALCSSPGAPIKLELIKNGIGTEVYSNYDNGILQPYFSIVAKNTNAHRKQEFVKIIEEVLNKLVKDGLDQNALEAGLNYFEFKYREADYGSYPKGLMYGLQMFDSWLYDSNRPFLHIEANETFALLREKIGTQYYADLISNKILNNTHKAIISVVPKQGLNVEKDRQLQEKLAQFKQLLTEEQIEKLVFETQALEEYQSSEDTKEDLAKIPMLSRADLDKNAKPFKTEALNKDKTTILFHDIFTNGVSYIRLVFDISDLKEEKLFTLGILKAVWGLMDTENFGYGEFFQEIYRCTGGVAPLINTYKNAKDTKQFRLHVECKAKVLYGEEPTAFRLMKELLLSTQFTDKQRFREILEETKSRAESILQSSGHASARLRAASNFSETAYIDENLQGIAFYKKLCAFLNDFDTDCDKMLNDLQQLVRFICCKNNLIVDYTGTKEGLLHVTECIPLFYNELMEDRHKGSKMQIQFNPKNEGFKTSGQVQYVCKCGKFSKENLKYTGELKVLKVMMGYEYLWNQVRVKGGAYGCMNNFAKSGESFFVSYRDPHLTRTMEVYEQAADYIKTYKADESTITKYIIGAISDNDMPLNPAAEGVRSMCAYFTEYTIDMEQKERDEILGATDASLQKLSVYIDEFMKNAYLCVIGSEEKMNQNIDLFDNIQNLLG